MNKNNHPIIIDFKSGQIYGILRGVAESNKLVILCPAATGTRLGPQRIYVEIAQKLEKINIASYCVDLPPLGDSFDNIIEKYEGMIYSEMLSKHYSKYLQIIIDYFKKEFRFNEFILLSISDGCMPVYNYAKSQEDIQKIILLSPNHQLDTVQNINKKNLKQYYLKLFKKETWLKLISMRLNLNKIIRNVYQKPIKKKVAANVAKEEKIKRTVESALVIFAEKEANLIECKEYWKQEKLNNTIESYSYSIIKGADHSFFGWQLKRDVEKNIIDWLSTQSNLSYDIVELF